MANIHKNDVGTVIEVIIKDEDNVAIDVSAATVKTIRLRNPAGTVMEKTAVFVTDGTDGKIKYTTVDGDLDATGDWRTQAYIEIGSTVKFYTDDTLFHVVGVL